MDLWDEFYLIMVDDLLDVSVDLISVLFGSFLKISLQFFFIGSLLDLAVKVAG